MCFKSHDANVGEYGAFSSDNIFPIKWRTKEGSASLLHRSIISVISLLQPQSLRRITVASRNIFGSSAKEFPNARSVTSNKSDTWNYIASRQWAPWWISILVRGNGRMWETIHCIWKVADRKKHNLPSVRVLAVALQWTQIGGRILAWLSAQQLHYSNLWKKDDTSWGE